MVKLINHHSKQQTFFPPSFFRCRCRFERDLQPRTVPHSCWLQQSSIRGILTACFMFIFYSYSYMEVRTDETLTSQKCWCSSHYFSPWAAAPSMEDATALEVTPARKLAEAEAAGWPGTGLGTFVRTAGLKVHLKVEILV